MLMSVSVMVSLSAHQRGSRVTLAALTPFFFLTTAAAAGGRSLPVIKSGWGSEVKGERWETDAVLTGRRGDAGTERERGARFTGYDSVYESCRDVSTEGRNYSGMRGIS